MKQNVLRVYLPAFLFGIFCIYIGAYVVYANPDNDIWWSMATGRYIWSTGIVPVDNPFIIHDGFHMIVQQWIMTVVNYLLYNIAGDWGLIWFALLCFLVDGVLIFRYTGCYSKNIKVRLGISCVGFVLLSLYLTTRPTLITVGILLVEQMLIMKWKSTGRKKYLWFIPLLSVLSINIHAALWPFLFIMVLPHIVPNFFDKNSSFRDKVEPGISFLFPVMVSIVVALINPNGINGVLYLFKSYGNAKIFEQISELQAPNTASLDGWLVMAACAIFSIYVYKNFQHIATMQLDISKIYMLAGVLILSMAHIRNIWTLLFGFVPVLCELFSAETGGMVLPINLSEEALSIKSWICYGLLYMFLTIGSAYFFYGSFPTRAVPLPNKAVDYLNTLSDRADIVLYNEFDTGGYLEWHGYKVYIDARPELFQKKINGVDDVADEYYAVENGEIDYAVFIKKYNFTHLLVKNSSYFASYLSLSKDYSVVLEDTNFALYECIYKEKAN